MSNTTVRLNRCALNRLATQGGLQDPISQIYDHIIDFAEGQKCEELKEENDILRL